MSESDEQVVMGVTPSKEVKRELFKEEAQGTSVDRADLSMIIKITKVNGESLPYGTVTEELIVELFQNVFGAIPLEIIIINDQDVLVDFVAGTLVCDAARAVHREAKWRDQEIRIGCIMATRHHLIIIQKEMEEVQIQRGELEEARRELWAQEQESKASLNEQTLRAKGEFTAYKSQMDDLTKRVNEQLDLLEVVRQMAEQEMLQRSRGSSMVDTGTHGKITKPPVFPAFSGEEPTPKDECGIETFLFQIRGARKDVTDQAVQSAVISALRGAASSYIEYIGLDSPLDFIIEQFAERFMTTAPPDTLVCQFHQLVQEEKTNQFEILQEELKRSLRNCSCSFLNGMQTLLWDASTHEGFATISVY